MHMSCSPGVQSLLLWFVAKLCPTFFCNPMNLSTPPGSSVYGISQAWILEWVAISFSRGSSQPRDQTHVSCIGRQILYLWSNRETLFTILQWGRVGGVHSQITNYSITNIIWQLWRKKNSRWTFLVVQMIRFHFPMQRVRVQSLVRELRHSMSPGQNTKT